MQPSVEEFKAMTKKEKEAFFENPCQGEAVRTSLCWRRACAQ